MNNFIKIISGLARFSICGRIENGKIHLLSDVDPLYFEIKPKEMYEIIQRNLGDFEIFLKHIKRVVEN
ncbi:hypothetical protein J7K42_01930 [bacterium]|nr:hypothetical protein [bacterium]